MKTCSGIALCLLKHTGARTHVTIPLHARTQSRPRPKTQRCTPSCKHASACARTSTLAYINAYAHAPWVRALATLCAWNDGVCVSFVVTRVCTFSMFQHLLFCSALALFALLIIVPKFCLCICHCCAFITTLAAAFNDARRWNFHLYFSFFCFFFFFLSLIALQLATCTAT